MANKEIKLPQGFDTYDDLNSALEQTLADWDKTGRTSLYSTGIPKLDEYLGGGFGQENGYEIVLIHSTSKTYKSTLAMKFMVDSLYRGIPQGWVILEGSLPEAINRARRTAESYEVFDNAIRQNGHLIYSMSKEMKRSTYRLSDILSWMKYLRSTKDVRLFFVDPIGYAFDFSTRDPYDNEWSRQARFMQELSAFAEDTNSTIVLVQHNTKDSGATSAFRAAAVGGSQTLTKAATKVIELRRNGTYLTIDGMHTTIALEYYFARHTRDHMYEPMILDISSRNDGIGMNIFVPTYRGADYADNQLGGSEKKGIRHVWKGQINE